MQNAIKMKQIQQLSKQTNATTCTTVIKKYEHILLRRIPTKMFRAGGGEEGEEEDGRKEKREEHECNTGSNRAQPSAAQSGVQ